MIRAYFIAENERFDTLSAAELRSTRHNGRRPGCDTEACSAANRFAAHQRKDKSRDCVVPNLSADATPNRHGGRVSSRPASNSTSTPSGRLPLPTTNAVEGSMHFNSSTNAVRPLAGSASNRSEPDRYVVSGQYLGQVGQNILGGLVQTSVIFSLLDNV
jgi:hypothetical protein